MTNITPLHLAIAFIIGGITGALALNAFTPDCPSYGDTVSTLVRGIKAGNAERDSLKAALGAVLNSIPPVQDSPDAIKSKVDGIAKANAEQDRKRRRKDPREVTVLMGPFDIPADSVSLIRDPQ